MVCKHIELLHCFCAVALSAEHRMCKQMKRNTTTAAAAHVFVLRLSGYIYSSLLVMLLHKSSAENQCVNLLHRHLENVYERALQ